MAHDRYGKSLAAGDEAILLNAPEELLRGLPQEDQDAILAAVGQPARVVAIHADGSAELEIPEVGGARFIWVACSELCLAEPA